MLNAVANIETLGMCEKIKGNEISILNILLTPPHFITKKVEEIFPSIVY